MSIKKKPVAKSPSKTYSVSINTEKIKLWFCEQANATKTVVVWCFKHLLLGAIYGPNKQAYKDNYYEYAFIYYKGIQNLLYIAAILLCPWILFLVIPVRLLELYFVYDDGEIIERHQALILRDYVKPNV